PLPVDINIDSVLLCNASIDIDGNLQQLTSLQLSASLQQHKLSLRDVTLDSDLLALQAQLAVTLAAPYPLTSDLQWQWLQSLPSNLTTPAQSNSQAHAEGTLHLAGDLN